ncbi:MAG: sodium:proton antiporter [Thermosulfidibacteraceae bacterium]|jgi:Na+/H+ antiporter NhaD/arsenite permease-like protein
MMEMKMTEVGTLLPIWSVIPFIAMLLSIAIFPMIAPGFWTRNYGKISIFWAFVTSSYIILKFGNVGLHEILHMLIGDYIPFIILIGALYITAGGLFIRGRFDGTPISNVVMLAVATFLASLIGTTGASMVLIRPLIRSNKNRRIRAYLIVIFIFLVSNIGGALTPIGDPPLFLGFLKGVPFFWTLRLIEEMLLMVVPLLLLFYMVDSYFYKRDKADYLSGSIEVETAIEVLEGEEVSKEKFIKIEGWYNLILIFMIVGSVIISGSIKDIGKISILGVERKVVDVVRDIVIVILAIISLKITPQEVRKKNEFSWSPIEEVAILFFGIFVSMVPPIKILQAGEKGALSFIVKSLREPYHYFWAAGSLSSFLDNAPTYLVFLNSAIGKFYPFIDEKVAVTKLLLEHPKYLEAISCGAVFFGSVTYIGNAPNLLTASIAAEYGVKMPSFFGYMFKYSIPILIPLFTLVTIVFFMS